MLLKDRGLSPNWSWQVCSFRISARTVTRIAQNSPRNSLPNHRQQRQLAQQAADRVQKGFPHWTVEIGTGARYTASVLADACVMPAFPLATRTDVACF